MLQGKNGPVTHRTYVFYENSENIACVVKNMRASIVELSISQEKSNKIFAESRLPLEMLHLKS